MITLTEHELSEWRRLAQAAYKTGRTAIGHKFSAAGALPGGSRMAVTRFDELQSLYREWLIQGFPEDTDDAQEIFPRQPGVYFVSDARDGGKRPVSRRYMLEQLGGNLLSQLDETGSLSCGTIIYSTR